MGHNIIYKTLKDLDTVITRLIFCDDENKEVIVPKKTVRNLMFLNVAIDNADLNKEILGEKKSTYMTAILKINIFTKHHLNLSVQQ